jgi:hypothetical protein
MRRLLPPLAAALIAAVVTLALAAPSRLPVSLLRLLSDAPGDSSSSAVMVEGGAELNLSVSHGDPGEVAERLERVGFEIAGIDGVEIRAYLPGSDSPYPRLESSGVYWPLQVAAIDRDSRVRNGTYTSVDIAEVRRVAGAVAIKFEYASVGAALDRLARTPNVSIALAEDRGRSWLVSIAEPGVIDGETLRFDLLRPWVLDSYPNAIYPSRDGALRVLETTPIAPSVSRSDTWIARAILAALSGLAAFALFAAIARRRPLRELVARDDDGAGRIKIVAAALVTAAVVAVGLLRGEAGPFMGSIHAGLIGAGGDTAALDLGYFVAICGFVAALILTLALPRWRSDLIGDGARGARLVRRGLVMTAIAGLLLIAEPFADSLGLVLGGWSAPDAAMFAFTALALAAVVFATATRALGGPQVAVALAVLAPAWIAFAQKLVEAQDSGAVGGGRIALVAVAIVAVCGATAAVVSRRDGSRETSLRAPVGGMMPLSIGVGIAVVFAVWTGHLPFATHAGVALAVAIPLTIAAALFELRIRRGLGDAQVSSLAGAPRRGEITAVAVSSAFIAAVLIVEVGARHLELPAFAVLSALSCAALMDLWAELRARWRRPTLTSVWTIHQPQLAGLVERALESRGLSCHMRAQMLRSCLGIAGAFIPITAMVDRARVDEAREIIGSLLEQPAAPERCR